ncbi:hypothetical protein [Nonomuraea sp. GTA35]|uniref:hypothetical protein n=1 Tax=Nonomuraea sp. GTA35 TaxID=1676746 RepID=UPI0035C0E109
MAAPTFVAAGAYLDGSAATAAVAVPAGTSAGRFVVVSLFMDGAALAVNPTPPSGFQSAPNTPVQIPSGSGNHSLYVWGKRLTGADSGTYDFTWTGSRYREAQAFLYQNVIASGDPWDLPVDTAIDLVSSTVTPPVDVTTLGPDRLLVWTATCWAGGTWTAPTGHTKRMQGGAGVITLTDRAWPAASNTGAITGTVTGSDKRVVWLGALIGTTSDGAAGTLSGALPALTAATSGTAAVTGTAAAGLPALAVDAAAAVTVDAALTATLPATTGASAGDVTAAGGVDGTLPPLTSAAEGAASSGGALAGGLQPLTASMAGATALPSGALGTALPPLAGTLDGSVAADGALTASLPPATAGLDSTASAAGAVAGALPALTAAFPGQIVFPQGSLTAGLPAMRAAFAGTSDGTELDIDGLVSAPQTRWPVGAPETRFAVGAPNA